MIIRQFGNVPMPIHMNLVNVCGVEPHPLPVQLHLASYLTPLSPGINGGGYRSRTDDPLRARQVLWPAELTPRYSILLP